MVFEIDLNRSTEKKNMTSKCKCTEEDVFNRKTDIFCVWLKRICNLKLLCGLSTVINQSKGSISFPGADLSSKSNIER